MLQNMTHWHLQTAQTTKFWDTTMGNLVDIPMFQRQLKPPAIGIMYHLIIEAAGSS